LLPKGLPYNSTVTLQADRITLLPESSHVTFEDIFERFGREQKVLLCDCYLAEIESRGKEERYGLTCGNIVNIDHHAPIASMERLISSTPLAVEYVTEFGTHEHDAVVINHTDCDSTLSSAIARGILTPEQQFSDAAIAADHTGEPDAIADLLQALDVRRNLDFSLRNLQLLLNGRAIDDDARALLDTRLNARKRALEMVESGAFHNLGHVTYAHTTAKIDGAFLPALLPKSWVIVLGIPLGNSDGQVIPGVTEIKVRLGKSAPPGMTLHSLGLNKDVAMNFAGRWNAGSNKRGGGTRLSVEECAEIVHDRLKSASSSSSPPSS
jgi:hypothetical protein